MAETLCWQCANACGGCAWSMKKARPVKGWTADKTKCGMKNGKPIESYIVRKCPEFLPDGREHRPYKLDIPQEVLNTIVVLRDRGVSYRKISELVGISETVVVHRYKKIKGIKYK